MRSRGLDFGEPSSGLTCGSVRLAAPCASLSVVRPPARTRRQCSSQFAIIDARCLGFESRPNGLQCALCSAVHPDVLRSGRDSNPGARGRFREFVGVY
jgi:hypothetical protein